MFKGAIEEFNKVQFYKTCLRNPNAKTRSFNVGKHSMNPHILAFIFMWVLTPRGSHHATLIEEDLMLMQCFINRGKVNWIFVKKDHIIKSKSLHDYKLPYVVLVSRLCECFKVDFEDELSKILKPTSEINHTMLNKIGLKKSDNGT